MKTKQKTRDADLRDRATTLAAPMQPNRKLALCCSLLAVAGLAACGDDGDSSADGASPTTTQTATGSGDEATTASSEPASSESSTTEMPEGCSGEGPEVPDGAASDQVDVDADGQDDTVWLAANQDGSRELGVLTAAGGGEKVEIDSASPVPLVALVADADEEAPSSCW